ncbi:MAG TPA: DUF4339 domain-containing protein [Planctomycetaceae bacterium]|nr:DUF4339 domain-containing protein [Planctomycetaceae bacterium]
MANNWYYAKSGEKHGPISSSELKQLASDGRLSTDDLVWREDMKDWKKASSVTGLFAAAPPSVPISAPPVPPKLPDLTRSSPDDSSDKVSLEDNISPFRFTWAEWNLGGKIIFVSACVAVISMLMKWVDVGITSANGFTQGTFIFLGFFIYPVWKLLKQKPIRLYGGVGSAAGGMLCTMVYMSERTVSFGGRSASLFGAGAVFFFLACGALAFGVYKYQQPQSR